MCRHCASVRFFLKHRCAEHDISKTERSKPVLFRHMRTHNSALSCAKSDSEERSMRTPPPSVEDSRAKRSERPKTLHTRRIFVCAARAVLIRLLSRLDALFFEAFTGQSSMPGEKKRVPSGTRRGRKLQLEGLVTVVDPTIADEEQPKVSTYFHIFMYPLVMGTNSLANYRPRARVAADHSHSQSALHQLSTSRPSI